MKYKVDEKNDTTLMCCRIISSILLEVLMQFAVLQS